MLRTSIRREDQVASGADRARRVDGGECLRDGDGAQDQHQRHDEEEFDQRVPAYRWRLRPGIPAAADWGTQS